MNSAEKKKTQSGTKRDEAVLSEAAQEKRAAELPAAHHMAWYQLLRAHAAVNGRIERRLAKAKQIPLGWYDVLVTLEKAPGHRLRLSELADAVVLSRSGLTRLIDKLEEAGLLKRETCPGDGRGAYAVLTKEGAAMRLEAWPEHSRGIMEFFARHLSHEEAQTLAAALQRVADAASEPGETPARPTHRSKRAAETESDSPEVIRR